MVIELGPSAPTDPLSAPRNTPAPPPSTMSPADPKIVNIYFACIGKVYVYDFRIGRTHGRRRRRRRVAWRGERIRRCAGAQLDDHLSQKLVRSNGGVDKRHSEDEGHEPAPPACASVSPARRRF